VEIFADGLTGPDPCTHRREVEDDDDDGEEEEKKGSEREREMPDANAATPTALRAAILGAAPDGNRIFMVALELVTILYAMLYAFPHIPTGVVDNIGYRKAFTWFNVTSTAAMHEALENLLRTSDVLEVSRAPGATMDDVTAAAVADPRALSRLFGLRLYERGVAGAAPATSRQMIEAICAVYRALTVMDIGTRDDLYGLYRLYQVLPTSGYALPGVVRLGNIDRSALVEFCSGLAVAWIQPYFSKDAAFYLPPAAARGQCDPIMTYEEVCGGRAR
jgi:hypothetical protein